ncbi:MAG: hypothetical protein HZA17_10495 [Nitrospirae bacterium]|nr:hypothetical protein [Nitrospirota bacterium]
MRAQNADSLTSILMESSLYSTLSTEERNSLKERLTECYPFLAEGADEETEIGYEASWPATIQKPS